MKMSEKLKKIRKAEGLTQVKFCEISGIALGTLKNYEGGHQEPGIQVVLQVTHNPRFKKYTLWLMADEINPKAGQIEPAFSLNGSDVSKKKEQKKSFHPRASGC
ncbi:helix-turn-helix domain-containing protein [Arsenophonus nasoniae]|nr:helix-turn-helix transcriptional regulator [Arsenophonus nasoniae]WGM05004.1 helix-turn-helix transcriptional regulator [Arsenophonus nasoniae]CBA76593.1 phage repressor protein c [Arsenophonus nasoniae]